MDVRLPDGTVITNVPDGTTQSELMRRVGGAQQAIDPTDGMSMFDKLAAGAGKAMYDTARGIGQLTGLVDQKSIDEAKRIDAPLMNTGAGVAGNVVGNLATMIGPGALLGAVGKAAQLPTAVNAARAFLAPKTVMGGAGIGAAMSALQPVASDESRGINTAIGGAVGGIGTAAANGLGRLLGPKAPTMAPDQSALVQRALDLGYQLKPSELTGKRWQQNLEAAMAQMPSTSGRMQAIGAANQAQTNSLVDAALARSGGLIDQPSAASSALEGMESGMSSERGRLSAAYNNLLNGQQVSLEAARPALEEIRQAQKALPETSQTGPAMDALNELLGAQNYGKKAKAYVKPAVDPNNDDIVTAIRKLGGITPTDEAVGSLARTMPFGPDPRFGPVWAKPRAASSTSTHQRSGFSLDYMAEKLHQAGYLAERDANELMDKLSDSYMGIGQHFSLFKQHEAQDPLAEAINSLTAKLNKRGAASGPRQPTQGYIRRNPDVPGDVAQNLRSDYTSMSADATGRDKTIYSAMRNAVDGAIEQSLPDAARGQFQAINNRYGVYAGLERLAPKQQQAFLNQLYRGSDSPDQFYTFLGMAPEGKFKDVARGFVSKIAEGATDQATGNVSAAKLGASINKANPEALKYLGGSAADLMRDVGNIGRDVLREQTPNSGSAQRLMYQGLLTGSGLGLGGYLGSSQGGSPGAVAGSALGAFALPKAAQSAYLSKALAPLLASGIKGRHGLLDQELIDRLIPLLGRASTAGLLGLSQ